MAAGQNIGSTTFEMQTSVLTFQPSFQHYEHLKAIFVCAFLLVMLLCVCFSLDIRVAELMLPKKKFFGTCYLSSTRKTISIYSLVYELNYDHKMKHRVQETFKSINLGLIRKIRCAQGRV